MAKLNLVKDMAQGSSYEESTSVGKTRKDKTCDICGGAIPKGSAHSGAKMFNDEYYQVDFCNVCEKKYKLQLKDLRGGKYDTY